MKRTNIFRLIVIALLTAALLAGTAAALAEDAGETAASKAEDFTVGNIVTFGHY